MPAALPVSGGGVNVLAQVDGVLDSDTALNGCNDLALYWLVSSSYTGFSWCFVSPSAVLGGRSFVSSNENADSPGTCPKLERRLSTFAITIFLDFFLAASLFRRSAAA